MVKLFSARLVLPSTSRFRMIVFRIDALALATDSEEIVNSINGFRRVDGFSIRIPINPLIRALGPRLKRTDQVSEEKTGSRLTAGLTVS